MPRAAYDRLGPRSARQLELESSRHYAHSVVALVFETGPLRGPDGGVDFAAIRNAIGARLHRVPRLRSRLRWIPFEDHPIWVDDHEFKLDYHIRHTSLAKPGAAEQLRTLMARIHSQRLDRYRPLWECWVAEGLERDRFALILKTHNAISEGGPDLLEALLSPDADAAESSVPPWEPRPVPSVAELFRDEIIRQARVPRRILRDVIRLTDRGTWEEELSGRARRIASLLGYRVRGANESPIEGQLGHHRRIDFRLLSLPEARGVARSLGGSVHDVVLTIVAGAAGQYFRKHFVNPTTLDFRTEVPVSVRAGDRSVDQWLLTLPVWETDPLARFDRVRALAASWNQRVPAVSARSLVRGASFSCARLLAEGARAMSPRARVSARVVNLPGPQETLHLCGAPMLEAYGSVPLAREGGLGISVISYDQKLCVTTNADFDRVVDLEDFGEALQASFRELVSAARRRDRQLALVDTAKKGRATD